MREIDLRTNSADYNKITENNQQVHERHNTYVNRNKIIELIEQGRAKDISLEEKKNGEPCIIPSSGPSLDLSVKKLSAWKGGVICQPSQALTLYHYGVTIDYIAVLDPFCEWKDFAGVDWAATKTKLIINPGCWPDIFTNWPNDFLLYRQSLSNPSTFYATAQRDAFMRRMPAGLTLTDPNYEPGTAFREAQFEYLITTEITSFACSPPFQIFCADFLKYGQLFLTGFDFGFTYGKDRFTKMVVKSAEKTVDYGGQKINVPIQWVSVSAPLDLEKLGDRVVMSDNGIPTEAIHLFYKKNLYSALRLSLISAYIVDEATTCHELPYISIDEVIEKQGQVEPFPKIESILIYEKYLAKVGAFVVDCGVGMSFIESDNPLGKDGQRGDIENFILHNIASNYMCKSCGSQTRIMPKDIRLAQAIGLIDDIISETKENPKAKEDTLRVYKSLLALPTMRNYNGIKCRNCKTGVLEQTHPANVESNLTRIKGLLYG